MYEDTQTLKMERQMTVSDIQTTVLSSLFSSATQADDVLGMLIHYRFNPDVKRQQSIDCKIYTNCKYRASACQSYERLS